MAADPKGDEEEQYYHVHRNVMVFGMFVESKYFASLLGDGGRHFDESNGKNEVRIQLSRVAARGFPFLLDFFYSGKLLPKESDVIDEESSSLILLGDYFQVPTLIDLITKRIHEQMKDCGQLPTYLPCIMVAQHIDHIDKLKP